jgi:hypothetical protein
MARLPSEQYLIQQADGRVRLFEDGSERLITAFDADDGAALPLHLVIIRDSELTDEDKSFALFWAGYFHGYSNRIPEMARETFITEADDGTVFVMDGNAIAVSFDPADRNACAQAQLRIHTSGLSQPDKDRAHFWSGFFYAHACIGETS